MYSALFWLYYFFQVNLFFLDIMIIIIIIIVIVFLVNVFCHCPFLIFCPDIHNYTAFLTMHTARVFEKKFQNLKLKFSKKFAIELF